jgi:hypothetical protein
MDKVGLVRSAHRAERLERLDHLRGAQGLNMIDVRDDGVDRAGRSLGRFVSQVWFTHACVAEKAIGALDRRSG